MHLIYAPKENLELRPGRGKLEYCAEFDCQHDVAFGLDFSCHERFLTVNLARRELVKCIVAHRDRHARFRRRTYGTRVDRPLLLEVDRPHGFLLLCVGDPQLEDGGGLFDMGGALGVGKVAECSTEFGKDVGCLETVYFEVGHDGQKTRATQSVSLSGQTHMINTAK